MRSSQARGGLELAGPDSPGRRSSTAPSGSKKTTVITGSDIDPDTFWGDSDQKEVFRLKPGVAGRYLGSSAKKEISQPGRILMKSMLLETYLKSCGLIYGEEGQDLVEYALIITLVALAAASGVQGVASAINTVFSNISNTLM
jgi:pilus assembly protein Flp/PilA